MGKECKTKGKEIKVWRVRGMQEWQWGKCFNVEKGKEGERNRQIKGSGKKWGGKGGEDVTYEKDKGRG
jgi:hypothetical protein